MNSAQLCQADCNKILRALYPANIFRLLELRQFIDQDRHGSFLLHQLFPRLHACARRPDGFLVLCFCHPARSLCLLACGRCYLRLFHRQCFGFFDLRLQRFQIRRRRIENIIALPNAVNRNYNLLRVQAIVFIIIKQGAVAQHLDDIAMFLTR